MKMQVLTYGIFLLLLQCNTAQSKLGKIPEFTIEPELYSKPLFRSQDITTTGHSTKITLIIEETSSPENEALFSEEFEENGIDNTAITVINISQRPTKIGFNFSSENQYRVSTLALFATYKKYQTVGTMIDEMFNPLEAFISKTFDQVAGIVGTGEISYEESGLILENVASNLLGLNSLDAETAEIMYDEDASEYAEEPFSKTTAINLNSFLTTAAGTTMMTVFNLYHLVLYELASKKATTSDTLDLANLTEIFINLEAGFMAAIEANLPKTEEPTTIQQIREVCFGALAAGRDFLHAQRHELWNNTLTAATNIAAGVERPVENLALFDFINEPSQIIITL